MMSDEENKGIVLVAGSRGLSDKKKEKLLIEHRHAQVHRYMGTITKTKS